MDITIYSTSSCSACDGLAAWLTQNGKSYTKKIVDTDDDLMDEFMAINGGMIGVPFTVITTDDGSKHKISGYDRNQFKQVLNI
jgi:glutaredoxin